ncbi:protein of unknown function [Pseudomonas mediterranea]
MLHDLVLDLQSFLLERLQGDVRQCGGRRLLGVYHLGIKLGVFVKQRVESWILAALLLDEVFFALEILAQIMGHRHGTPPFGGSVAGAFEGASSIRMALPKGFCRPPIRPAVTVRRTVSLCDQTFAHTPLSIEQ